MTREYYLAHQEEVKRKSAEYKETHPEQTLATNAEYRLLHREEMRNRSAVYMAAHREEQAAYSKEYWAIHKTEHAAKCNRWIAKNPEDRRISHSKSKSKRRALGFIPSNQSFIGCEAHHVDHDRVLYIPSELHKSVSHNVWTGYNMDKMNILAFQWLEQATYHV